MEEKNGRRWEGKWPNKLDSGYPVSLTRAGPSRAKLARWCSVQQNHWLLMGDVGKLEASQFEG